MLIKWIICRVIDHQREAFSVAQQSWHALADVEGFQGQLGGWHANDPAEACILGLWRHAGAYRAFMSEMHDLITAKTSQDSMYDSICIGLYDLMFKIPGSTETLEEACAEATILRVAQCEVFPNRQSHFVRMQLETWNPGMSRHEAMLGGLFSRSATDANRFLVVTWWRDRKQHDAYAATSLPELREAASVECDVRHLEPRIITLNPSWWASPVA